MDVKRLGVAYGNLRQGKRELAKENTRLKQENKRLQVEAELWKERYHKLRELTE